MESSDNPHTSTFQDVSGALGLLVEVLLVGVNVLPILSVFKAKEKHERTVTDQLVVALSVSDVLAVLLPTPLAMAAYFGGGWYGEMCPFYQVTSLSLRVTSVFLMSYMCLDRTLVLRQILFYKVRSVHAINRVKYIVVVIYVLSLIISSMPSMESTENVDPQSRNNCQSLLLKANDVTQIAFHGVFLSVGYANTLSVLVVNSITIFLLLRLRKKMRPVGSRPSNIPELQTERRSTFEYSWMVLACSAVFYITWSPVLVMVTVQTFAVEISEAAILYAFFISRLTGLVNPLLYGLFSKTYRRGYKHVIVGLASCICQWRDKTFHPVPAITWDSHLAAVEEEGITTVSRRRLKKSKSFHDKPTRGGFQNLAMDSSVHSELGGKEDIGRFRGVLLERGKQKQASRRSKSLTPISGPDNIQTDRTLEGVSDKCPSTDSSLSSGGSDADHSDSGDSSDEEANRGCPQPGCGQFDNTFETTM